MVKKLMVCRACAQLLADAYSAKRMEREASSALWKCDMCRKLRMCSEYEVSSRHARKNGGHAEVSTAHQ